MKAARKRGWMIGLVLAAVVLCILALHICIGEETGADAEEDAYLSVGEGVRADRGQEACIRVAGETWADAGEGLISGDEAVARAAAYIGIADLSDVTVSVDRVVPEGDQTPFLNGMVNDRPCYVVTLDGVDIRIPWGSEEERVLPVRTLNALLDARTGQLLKLWSGEWLDPPSMRRPAAEVEDELRNYGGEEWQGFPEQLPKISFLELLYMTRFPSHMQQLDAVYVVRNGRPTWLVTVFDTSPIETCRERPEQAEPFPVYGWRMGNDGETGELYIHSTVY